MYACVCWYLCEGVNTYTHSHTVAYKASFSKGGTAANKNKIKLNHIVMIKCTDTIILQEKRNGEKGADGER